MEDISIFGFAGETKLNITIIKDGKCTVRLCLCLYNVNMWCSQIYERLIPCSAVGVFSYPSNLFRGSSEFHTPKT